MLRGGTGDVIEHQRRGCFIRSTRGDVPGFEHAANVYVYKTRGVGRRCGQNTDAYRVAIADNTGSADQRTAIDGHHLGNAHRVDTDRRRRFHPGNGDEVRVDPLCRVTVNAVDEVVGIGCGIWRDWCDDPRRDVFAKFQRQRDIAIDVLCGTR